MGMQNTPKSETSVNIAMPTCQSDYIAMPAGWSLVPYSADIVTNVVDNPSNGAIYQWGTHCLIFSNGASYGTESQNRYCRNCMLLRSDSGTSYKSRYCGFKVLIRRP